MASQIAGGTVPGTPVVSSLPDELTASLVQLTHTSFRGDRQLWALGSRYFVKEWICDTRDQGLIRTRGLEHTTPAQAAAHDLLRAKTDVPVPRVLTAWFDGQSSKAGLRGCMILERIPSAASDLRIALPQAPRWTYTRLAAQVARFIQEWRSRLTAQQCQSVQGGPLATLPGALVPAEVAWTEPLEPCGSDDAVFDRMFRPYLERKGVGNGEIRWLRSRMPSCEPYVFSHLDLHPGNVLIDARAEEVVGIVDFEFAGYWPVWFEGVLLSACGACELEEEDDERDDLGRDGYENEVLQTGTWKKMLLEKLHPDWDDLPTYWIGLFYILTETDSSTAKESVEVVRRTKDLIDELWEARWAREAEAHVGLGKERSEFSRL